MQATATAAKVTWKLTGQPEGGGECEHCGRNLVHRYSVTSSKGQQMTVGRGCLKSVTGWTLTAAQAAAELRMIETRKRRAANWAAFTAGHPAEAETLEADCAAFAEMFGAHHTAGASHEIRYYIEDGEPAAMRCLEGYLQRRGEMPWIRG